MTTPSDTPTDTKAALLDAFDAQFMKRLMPSRCTCGVPEQGAYSVCRRCGGEYQPKHSEHCNCMVCEAKRKPAPVETP